MKKILALCLALLLCLFSFTASAETGKYNGRTDFVWGVSGHHRAYNSYSQDPELYIKAVAEMGVKLYRMNIHVTSQEDIAYLDKCVMLCDAYGLDIAVLLYLQDDLDANTNYYEMIASRYDGKSGHGLIDYFEVGGEEEVPLLLKKYPVNGPAGDSVDHYYESDLIELQAKFASAIKGIRQSGSPAKVMIDFSHMHYAPLLYMYERGLDFDIIGLDWYTNMGPLNQILDPVIEKFPHDIFITETNLWQNEGVDENNIENWNTVFEFMDIAYASDRVKGFCFYELMDEPEFEDNDGFSQEAHFGLIKANRDGTFKEIKPIYNHLKGIFGGGPVKKQEIVYENVNSKPEEAPETSAPEASVPETPTSSEEDTSTEESKPSDTKPPKTQTVVQEVLTTNTTEVFPMIELIIGSAVILLLTVAGFILIWFRPAFIVKLFKRKK